MLARVKDPADVPSIEAELWSTIAGLQREPVDAARLDATRSRLKYSFLSGLSTPSNVSNVLARIVAITEDVTAVDEMFATLDAVTPEDVQRAAQHFLRPERCTVAVVHSAGEPLASASAGAQTPVLMPVPQDPNVAFKLWFQVGSQDDPRGKEGLAALTAAMVSDAGTERQAYDEILAKLFPLAAAYWASVDKEEPLDFGLDLVVAARNSSAPCRSGSSCARGWCPRSTPHCFPGVESRRSLARDPASRARGCSGRAAPSERVEGGAIRR